MHQQQYGYDKERFPKATPTEFDCPICSNVAKNPKECQSCGIIWCASCIDSWLLKKKECPNRCDPTKTQIGQPQSKALLRLYNDIDIKCQFCQKIFKISEIENHEIICQMPKCPNYEICQQNAKIDFKELKVCDPACYLQIKLKNSPNPVSQLKEIKEFLSNFKNANIVNQSIMPVYNPLPNISDSSNYKQNSQGPLGWTWSLKNKGTGIELSESNYRVWLKESQYMFRTVLGDLGMTNGVYYWEIIADDRTENELKIGIATRSDFNMNSAFCDFEYGYAFYGLGQLRHNSNASGPQYGKRFKKEGVLGCCLNMNKGQMSFSLNGEFLGIAYTNDALKRGPIYAAVSLLHCAGCKLDTSKPAPSIFPQ